MGRITLDNKIEMNLIFGMIHSVLVIPQSINPRPHYQLESMHIKLKDG